MGSHWRFKAKWHDLNYALKGTFCLLSFFLSLPHYHIPKSFSIESKGSLRNDYPLNLRKSSLVLTLAHGGSPSPWLYHFWGPRAFRLLEDWTSCSFHEQPRVLWEGQCDRHFPKSTAGLCTPLWRCTHLFINHCAKALKYFEMLACGLKASRAHSSQLEANYITDVQSAFAPKEEYRNFP